MGQSFQDIFWKTLRPLSEDFKNKKVADVPAGKGQSSLKLKSLGAEVYPLYLVPDFFEAEGLECQFCDLNQQLPLDSNSMDVILSQEGIEHISDQNLAFKEFSRVLKKGGTLILSSPNGSSLKSRFSFLMGECEKSGKILPPNLFDSIWFNPGESSQVYFGHLLHGMPISVLSGFGVVALIGVLVNDALVFITSFNLRLKKGESFLVALEITSINRFRPIILTTITTVFGLLPLIFEKSMQAQFLIPMAISLSYGIIMATLLTLLFLPVLLLTVNNIRLFISRNKSREEVEPAVKELKNNI